MACSGKNLTSWNIVFETLTLREVLATFPLFHARWNLMILFTIHSVSTSRWIVSWSRQWRRGRIYLRNVGNHLPSYTAPRSTRSWSSWDFPVLSERFLFSPGSLSVRTTSRLQTLLIRGEIRTTCSYCTISANVSLQRAATELKVAVGIQVIVDLGYWQPSFQRWSFVSERGDGLICRAIVSGWRSADGLF